MDASRWPLVVVRWPSVTTMEVVERYFVQRQKWLDARTPHAIVIDGSASLGLDATTRKRVTELGREQADLAGRWCVGEAIVMTSAVQRGVLTAIEWIWRPPHPRRAFGDVASAMRWAEETLARSAPRPSVGL